ncbi:DUF58 domain-containing protein [Methylobacterium frigidaeris]|uniref:DUF58 domain-containing protein n=1 Tax=Methylobacterium frigidaeris TaxID=2038277 RepID=A0AA37H8G8_9HYPH|nr:DUF58 domain-containing protein [Methylobacterium frigidaeris]PIK72904.1 DUF58 domain-containing protein [Methylobacterium frigidaeris]GJD61265.1 hypothetical protein MPEAHAMD_1405 [Methylobacterium frigidaeris]
MGLRHLARRGAGATTKARSGLPGGIVTRRRGRGTEPDDVRLWAEGDDVRHIDRNATARTGTLHVRTHHDERDRAVVLLADFRPSMLFGTRRALRSVAAAEALALLGWRIAGDGGRVGLCVAAPEPVALPPRGGGRGMAALCQGLARAHEAALAAPPHADPLHADPPLGPTLERARALLPAGGHLVLASALDAPGDGFAESVAALAERISLSLILVSDPFERAAPPGLYPYATPDGRRGTARIGRTRPTPVDRLAAYTRLGLAGLRLDTELGPEGFAPLMERLDAVL